MASSSIKILLAAEPPPPAPAANKRVQSRDSMGDRYPLNIPRLPTPERTIITKAGVVLRTGYTNMLERMVSGTPQQQHIQLQMLKGLYKTETCRYDATGTCRAGDSCCFRHRVDNEHNISQRVAPIRRRYSRGYMSRICPAPRDLARDPQDL